MVKELTVFFPAYNEADNLPFLIRDCDQFLKNNLPKYEIIVVDDGSTDNTTEVVKGLLVKYPKLRLVSHRGNQGYGAAIKTGIKEARFPYVFFMDSDNQFKFDDLKQFLGQDDFDLVIGFRIKRHDPASRIFASKVYGLFVKSLFGPKVKDIDCAFKLMKKSAVENLKIKSDSFFVSTELLVRAQRNGLKIKEIGVSHYPRREGQSTVTKERVIQSLIELKKLYFSLK